MEAIQQREISVLKEADPVPIEKNDNGTWFSQMLNVHPGRLTWNLQVNHFERKLIFQTSMRTCSMLIFQCVFLYIYQHLGSLL